MDQRGIPGSGSGLAPPQVSVTLTTAAERFEELNKRLLAIVTLAKRLTSAVGSMENNATQVRPPNGVASKTPNSTQLLHRLLEASRDGHILVSEIEGPLLQLERTLVV